MEKITNKSNNKVTINKDAFANRGKMTVQRVVNKGKIAIVIGLAALMLTGCDEYHREVATNSHVTYDVIDTMDNELVQNGIQQVLDVPGEKFKVLIDYKCLLEDNARWTVTSDKELYIDVCTMGLPDDTKVYIENVHIDTTIRSHYPSVDGITQDTMDDRIHNSQMKGFPISDFNHYSNVNCIEGQNQTFMQGSFYGFRGYSSGTITERRYVESHYLSAGVYANKIDVVMDLIIDKPNGITSCVSVPSTIGVSVWPYIEKIGTSTGSVVYDYYYWDAANGRVTTDTLTADEYQARLGEGEILGK